MTVSKDVTTNSPMNNTPEYVVDEESLLRETSGLSLASSLDQASSTHSVFLTPPELTLERISDSLRLMNLQPVNKTQMANLIFKSRKINEILSAYSDAFNKIFRIDNTEGMCKNRSNYETEFILSDAATDPDTDYAEAGKEMISQLKRKFPVIDSNGDKRKLLSVLPASWSLSKVQQEFNVSKHMVVKTKQLVEDQGVLCTSAPKVGNLLPPETTDQVISFYLDPEVSRKMPGKKDYVSVAKDEERKHIQKRLVLGNLQEIFLCYSEKYPNSKVSFSKFAMLRPKECVLAGASGTHTVCVCTNHHNFKLMLLDANLKSLKFNDKSLNSYKDFLECIKCASPSESCHLMQCDDYSGTEGLKRLLEDHFANEFVNQISYKQWVQFDRCTLDGIIQPVDEFIDVFIDKLKKLSPHDYIAKKQAEYFQSLKEEIKQGEVLVIADFSENYSFVIQDSAQGMHWNNAQATIHPFACYYRPEENSAVQTLNFLVLSDDLTRNTASVHLKKILIEFLKTVVPNFRKIICMSDGAASQYKNRFNIMNVCWHEKDFAIPAEWHFYTTSHGKGPRDGLGGTLKRLATQASLQRPFDNQLQTPEQLYHWAKDNISDMQFNYASKTDIANHTKMLNKRFDCSTPITGIRSFHACLPRADGNASMKMHSFSKDEIQFHVLQNWDREDTPDTAVLDLPRVTRSSKRKKYSS